MLNPWLAITFQTMRLGFEAQNAVTLRVMRLAATSAKPTLVARSLTRPPRRQMLKRPRQKLRQF
jgi:hypothetical protein